MKRTRRGYVVCGGCLRHVQLVSFDGTESCPFCATRVDVNAAGSAVTASSAGGTRSGVLFAALLGAASMGCGTSQTSDPPPAEDAQDPGTDGSTDVAERDLVDEPMPAPEYGLPADVDIDGGRPDTGTDTIDEDVPVEPLYGMPAEDVIEPDVPAEPPYGIPPMPDASDDDIEDPMPQPEYGLPPEDDEDVIEPPAEPLYGMPSDFDAE
jgi:hypothetical protein